MKDIKDLTFNELIEIATQHIHSALLEEGGKGMKQAVFNWMGQAIIWKQTQKKS